MNPQEYAEIQNLINQKVPNASHCVSCGKANAVQLAAHIVTPVATSVGGTIALQGANYPQAMLLCTNCGFTTYYNVIVLKHGQGPQVG
jgi:predicted nucleic-acid-binding Zn-ribbon protein